MLEPKWPVSISKNFYQFSYRIVENPARTRHSLASLAEAIRLAGESVKNVVWTGWSMFHQFTTKEIAPRVVLDEADGEEIEAFETNLLDGARFDTTVPDFWRITIDGRATLLRPYREDRNEPLHLKRRGLQPGMWLSPHTLMREVYEFVSHAKELAKAFPNADRVEFRCSWHGLKGRQIADFRPGVDWDEHTCHTNERTIQFSASTEQLTGDTASIAVELAAPVLRLFGLELTKEWVLSELPSFRSI